MTRGVGVNFASISIYITTIYLKLTPTPDVNHSEPYRAQH